MLDTAREHDSGRGELMHDVFEKRAAGSGREEMNVNTEACLGGGGRGRRTLYAQLYYRRFR